MKRVYLLTYGDEDENKYRDYLAQNVSVLFNRFHLPTLIYSLFAPIIYWRIFKKADIYRTHQVWGSWVALIAKLLYRKKLIVRQGYQLSIFLKKRRASSIRRFFVWFLEFLSYHITDRVIVTSQNDKSYIVKKYLVKPEKIVVIPNYVDVNVFKPLDNVTRDKRKIAFVGRLDPQKNLHALIDAVKDLDAELLVLGDGPLRKVLEDKVEREGIRNVKFLGKIPNEKLPHILNGCGIFILPSLYEGNPKALLEAMACGLPVIGTDVEGIRDLIRHKENGYLCGVGAESIRNAITTLMYDDELRVKLSLNARRFVEENFSLKKVIEAELKLYLTM
jgi:glycosyltransferase involved in cell wall biosynthesis